MGKVAHQHQRLLGCFELAPGQYRIILRGQAPDLPEPTPGRKGTSQDFRGLSCPELVGMKYFSDFNLLCSQGACDLLYLSLALITQRALRIFVFGLGLAVPDQIEIHKLRLFMEGCKMPLMI